MVLVSGLGVCAQRYLRKLFSNKGRDRDIELEREILLSKKPLAFYEIGSSIGEMQARVLCEKSTVV